MWRLILAKKADGRDEGIGGRGLKKLEVGGKEGGGRGEGESGCCGGCVETNGIKGE